MEYPLSVSSCDEQSCFCSFIFHQTINTKRGNETIPKVKVISYCLRGELWLLAIKTSVINSCSESIQPGEEPEQATRTAIDKSSPMEYSRTIFEEYHIDEDVGFALPLPLVRGDTGIWAKLFSYLDLLGQVNFY